MSLSLKVTANTVEVSETLAGILRLGGRGLQESIASRGKTLTRQYLIGISRERHRSAQKLGAQPTGHLERAADQVSSHTTDTEATISINSPGFGRVQAPITIRAKRAKNLTIPIHAISYGRTVAQVRRLTGQRLFRPGPKNAKKKILAITRDKQLIPLFALTPKVTLRRDRSLLPSDPAYHEAATAGIRDYVAALIRRSGARSQESGGAV